jgi:uncharacterized protein Smg (DUF494 family)
MNDDDVAVEPVQKLLGVIADHLERWFEGDELALEGLGEALQEQNASGEQIQAAFLTLRSLAGAQVGAGVAALDEPPGHRAERVPSAEERESLSPEAWGYLLNLRRRGSLDANQFERVLDRLTALGVRPVGVDLAREMAARIALRAPNAQGPLEDGAGDGELAH